MSGVLHSELKARNHGCRAARIEAEIDRRLALMCAQRRPGETYTYRQISAFCGWSHGGAYAVECRALKKLRRAFARATVFRDAHTGPGDFMGRKTA